MKRDFFFQLNIILRCIAETSRKPLGILSWQREDPGPTMALATSRLSLAMRGEEVNGGTRQQYREVQVLSIEPTKREHSD